MIEVRVEVRPPWPVRLPGRGAPDGVLRVRGGVVHRLLHVGAEPVVVRAVRLASGSVLFGARGTSRDAAAAAIARLRFALGVDDDLAPFHARFRADPLLGPLLRADVARRVLRRPEPFEALAWAVTEQLIDYPRAAAIQRRIVRRFGRRCERSGLCAPPAAATLAGAAPAELQAMDLSAGRALALVRAAREVASGRADLDARDHEPAWQRLRAIPGIGAWTLEQLALAGQGRYDQVPAGDLNLLKLVGRLRSGNPLARAEEPEVREFFAPYAPWGGLAASYLMGAPADRLPIVRSPRPRGTRSSAPRSRAAAA